MKITIEIKQKELASVLFQLHEQMGHYGTKTTYLPMVKGGVVTFIGEKFNVYVYPCKTALLANTKRKIEILPKEEII